MKKELALTINDVLNKLLLADKSLKLTTLRKEILKIFIQARKPISAYDVLSKLKKKRDGAEPPTVYRVIDYFIQKNIIHRLDTENKYIFCNLIEHSKPQHQNVIFICKNCLTSFEVSSELFQNALKDLSVHYQFNIHNVPIEIKGICRECMPSTFL